VLGWRTALVLNFRFLVRRLLVSLFSARCNISRLCYYISVRLSVTEVHWRIIATLGFKFRSQFTAHCGRGARGREHLTIYMYIQGAPIKNNPLGKIHYLSYCNSFFSTKFTAFTEDSRNIRSKFRHNICYGLKLTTI